MILYKFDHFVLDKAKYCLQVDKRDIRLTPKVFDLLLMLVENRDRTLSIEDLLDHVWSDAQVLDTTVYRHIVELRKVLGDDAENPRFIKTFPKRGYRFIAEVEEVLYRETGQVEHRLLASDLGRNANDWDKDVHSDEQPESRSFGLGVAKNASSSLQKVVQSYQQREEAPQPENFERIRKLFFPKSGPMELYPADDHPIIEIPQGHTTYPNQERAMQAIRNLFGEAKQVVEEKYPSDPRNTLVCIGSSVSHRESRRIMGDPQKGGRFKHIGPDYEIDFPYTIVSLDAYVARLQDGKERVTRHCGVIDSNRTVVAPEHYKSRLAGDILLITRIPRILGSSDVLIFAGTHGPAILAIELLLNRMDPSDLDYLEKCVEGSRYFQAMFHIPTLCQMENTTVPLEIHCDRTEDFRPRPIKARYRRR